MTDINPNVKVPNEVTERVYEQDEPDPTFYVEKETGFIYEAKMFGDFALIRLVMPDHQPPVAKIDLIDLAHQFDEFCGDVKELRSLMFGSTASFIQVEKKKSDKK